mgnify:CR=1 FL=1
MPRQLQGYEAFIRRLQQEWREAEQATLPELVERTSAYLEAAGELTKDELALIREYVHHDLQAFLDAPGGYRDSAFFQALQHSIWAGLLELCDRTRIEWLATTDELARKGVYQAGERVAFGQLVCEQCGQTHTVLHPERILPCIQCGGTHFRREPLAP